MGTVDELIRELQSSRSYKERRDAASALGRLGEPKAVPALLRTLKNYREDTEVLHAAAHAVGKIGDLYAVPELLDAYEATENKVEAPIFEAIGEILGRTSPDDDNSREIYSRAVDTLIQAVQNHRASDESRADAARALGKTRDPKAIPVLTNHLLEDHRREVRVAAAVALRHFNHPQAIHALVAATNKKIPRGVREAAVQSLGVIGNPNAVDTLIQILEDGSEEYFIRTEAARALGRIGDPKAIEPLIRTLHNEWHKTAGGLRKTIAEALGAFHDPRVTDALVNALARDYDTARAAAESLKKLRDRRAVEPLIRRLEDKQSGGYRRALPAEILGVLGDPRAIPALAKALHDDDEDIRKAASKSLLAFVPTHPDAILRLPPDARHRLGRLIQDAQRKELSHEICK